MCLNGEIRRIGGYFRSILRLLHAMRWRGALFGNLVTNNLFIKIYIGARVRGG